MIYPAVPAPESNALNLRTPRPCKCLLLFIFYQRMISETIVRSHLLYSALEFVFLESEQATPSVHESTNEEKLKKCRMPSVTMNPSLLPLLKLVIMMAHVKVT